MVVGGVVCVGRADVVPPWLLVPAEPADSVGLPVVAVTRVPVGLGDVGPSERLVAAVVLDGQLMGCEDGT